MFLKQKRNIILIGCVLLVIISGYYGYAKVVENNKINLINNVMLDFKSDYKQRTDAIRTIEIYLNDNNIKVAQLAKATKDKIIMLYDSKDTYDRVKNALEKDGDTLWNSEKQQYIDRLKTGVSKESEYYMQAQELIRELSGESANIIGVEIESYSRHYSKGKQDLNIYLTNTSGKDIEYLALDIFELDLNNNIINSNWTNNASLIKNNAKVSIDTFFDYKDKNSKLRFEIKDIRYK